MSTVKVITAMIEGLAPKNLAFNWDNVGLQVGSENSEVKEILLCLDVNEETIDEAIEKGVQLIVAHHPLIFSPMKTITKEDYKGKIIFKAIEHNINIYVAHTNIDGAEKGLNTYVANRLNLKNIEVLDPLDEEGYYKIVVFVPEGHVEPVAEALAGAGAGHIGNYSHCSFRSKGEGTFMPLEGTNPFIGEVKKIEKAKEIKLETIIDKRNLTRSIQALIEAHPYEEVAYDVYKLYNSKKPRLGIGRVGILDEPILFKDYIAEIKKVFNIATLKTTGNLEERIEKIAIVNGSGADYISRAKANSCDVLITGDVKYHDAQKAEELGLKLIDVGHYESEVFFMDLLNKYLTDEFIKENIHIEIINSEIDGNPFTII